MSNSATRPLQSGLFGNMILAPGRLMITGAWWTTSCNWWLMKAKKTAPQRRRISFAVDRDEIEVNSDWVEAVMASPTRPAAPPVESSSTAVPATVQQQQIFSKLGVLE